MEVRKEDQRDPDEKVVEIEIERLRDFKNHPFKVQADSQMKELQESIKKYGILNPLIVRPRTEGFYEIIYGHRRKYAAQQLKYTKVPVIIRWAYVTAAWSTDRSRAKRSAKRYCRKLYEAGYTPICPLLSLPEIINVSNADEFKDYIDMSEDMLRRSRILVVCGTAVDETVLTDIAIANRFHVASSTMRGVLTVDKSKKFE